MDKIQYAAKLAAEMKSAGHNFTRPKAEDFVNALIKAMAEGLASDHKLTLSNFGTFIVSRFGAKIINSPRGDKRQFFMPPTDVIKWRPSMKVRDRAPTSKVSEDEYQKLISGEITDELPEEPLALETKERKLGRYEVKISVYGGADVSHISDDQSPISKLAKSLIRDFLSTGSQKLEIRPESKRTVLIYWTGDSAKSVKTLPIASHKIIIEKLKFLSGEGSDGKAPTIRCDAGREIKFSTALTSSGESAILELI